MDYVLNRISSVGHLASGGRRPARPMSVSGSVQSISSALQGRQ